MPTRAASTPLAASFSDHLSVRPSSDNLIYLSTYLPTDQLSRYLPPSPLAPLTLARFLPPSLRAPPSFFPFWARLEIALEEVSGGETVEEAQLGTVFSTGTLLREPLPTAWVNAVPGPE